ncbi:Sec-independent protein translocase subunit TatA/TatB [Croceimicrobium sp.]|uniref:Sec-independent protein translocase subunit TatA/TatB n=1 Tax=Croceimicrobium sp. TaxID=2828340 RepID=UPI003BA85F0D|tara:strand:+ start:344 stop:628 length:285 start_codon:yes stop_codon:yes gene_type:complete
MIFQTLPFMFFNISGGEIVVILLLVIMFFGANRIPEIARGIGKGIREVRNATEDIKNEINKTSEGSDLKKFKDKIESEKKEIEEITGSIKRNKF